MTNRSLDQLAIAQYGLVTLGQLRELGYSSRRVELRVRSGMWERVHRGVYRLEGAAPTHEQAILASVLGGGRLAAASHRAAAWLWGLVDAPSLEITIPPARRVRLDGVIVHRRDLPAASISRRRRITTVNPLVSVLDMGASADLEMLHQCLDRGVAARLFTSTAVAAELARSGSGRPGVQIVREALAWRLEDESRPASVLQSHMSRVFRRHRLPIPTPEYWVLDGRYRLDFAWPQWRLALEVDGYESHSSVSAFRRDRRRRRELTGAGWTILEYVWEEVRRDAVQVAADVEREIARLAAA